MKKFSEREFYIKHPIQVKLICGLIVVFFTVFFTYLLTQNKEPTISVNQQHQEINGIHVNNSYIVNNNNYNIIVNGVVNISENGKLFEMELIKSDGETDLENGTFTLEIPSLGNAELRTASNTITNISIKDIKKNP